MTTSTKTTWVPERRGARMEKGNWGMLREGGIKTQRQREEGEVEKEKTGERTGSQSGTEIEHGQETPHSILQP